MHRRFVVDQIRRCDAHYFRVPRFTDCPSSCSYVGIAGSRDTVAHRPASLVAGIVRARLVAALEEVAQIARAHGKNLNAETIGKTLAMIDAQRPETTSSMQRDIMAGRPSELEAQTGALVRFGKKTGIVTPVHDSIYAELLPPEKRARGLA